MEFFLRTKKKKKKRKEKVWYSEAIILHMYYLACSSL